MHLLLIAAFTTAFFIPYDAEAEEGGKPVQYLLKQILIEPGISPEHEAEVLAQAKDCLSKALAGEDFTRLAKTLSQEPGAERTGGDLGYFERENMVKPFSDKAFSMKPGEISGPVKTQYGYHIIKLIDSRDSKRHAQHILFSLTPGKSDSLAVLNRLLSIRKQLVEGADFSEVLRSTVTNEMILSTDGYMVWQSPDTLLPSFLHALEGLKEGDISEPFLSIIAYHILVVDSINYDGTNLREGFPAHIQKKLEQTR